MAFRSKWQLNDEIDSIESKKFRSKWQKQNIDTTDSIESMKLIKSQKLMVQIDSSESTKCL